MLEKRTIPTIVLPPSANSHQPCISINAFADSFAYDNELPNGSQTAMPIVRSNDLHFGPSLSLSSGSGNVVKGDVLGLFVFSRRRAPLFLMVFTVMTVLSYSFLPSSSSFLILRNYKTLTEVPYDDALDVHVRNPLLPPSSSEGSDEGGSLSSNDNRDAITGGELNSGLTAPSLHSVKQGILHASGPLSETAGFPPADLPRDHPNAELLGEIRTLTALRPRWPSVNETPVFTLRSYGPAFSSIIVSHKLKVVYIPVFKVGTSSIMWCIAFLENLEQVLRFKDGQPEERHVALHDMSSPVWANHTIWDKPEQDVAAVFKDPSYMKFGFVRNPYDRAVSAYTDKIVQADVTSQEYRRQLYSLFGMYDWTAKHMSNNKNSSQQQQKRPTFSQFMHAVQRVVAQPRTVSPHAIEDSESRSELYWRTQSELLHPDLIQLDFVGRFERMEADLEVVLEWMYRHTTRRIPKDMKIKLQATDPGLKASMLETLGEDRNLVDCIQSVYASDFHRFQYSTTIPDIEGIPDQIE